MVQRLPKGLSERSSERRRVQKDIRKFLPLRWCFQGKKKIVKLTISFIESTFDQNNFIHVSNFHFYQSKWFLTTKRIFSIRGNITCIVMINNETWDYFDYYSRMCNSLQSTCSEHSMRTGMEQSTFENFYAPSA